MRVVIRQSIGFHIVSVSFGRDSGFCFSQKNKNPCQMIQLASVLDKNR
jgi:hypothetical protein